MHVHKTPFYAIIPWGSGPLSKICTLSRVDCEKICPQIYQIPRWNIGY